MVTLGQSNWESLTSAKATVALFIIIICTLIFQWHVSSTDGVLPGVDEAKYITGAQALFHGEFDLTSQPGLTRVGWKRFGLTVPLALWGEFFGFDTLSLTCFSMLWVLLLVLFTYLIALELAGERVAILTAFFVAFSPDVLLWGPKVNADIPYLAYLMIALYYLFIALRTERRGLILAAGGFLALAYLTKVFALIGLFFFALLLLMQKRRFILPWLFMLPMAALLLESLLYAWLTGDLGYRFYLSNEEFFANAGIINVLSNMQERLWGYYFTYCLYPGPSYGIYYLFLFSIAAYALLQNFPYKQWLVLWIVGWVLFLNFAPAKLDPYIPLPAVDRYWSVFMPLLAVVSAYGLIERMKRRMALVWIIAPLLLLPHLWGHLLLAEHRWQHSEGDLAKLSEEVRVILVNNENLYHRFKVYAQRVGYTGEIRFAPLDNKQLQKRAADAVLRSAAIIDESSAAPNEEDYRRLQVGFKDEKPLFVSSFFNVGYYFSLSRMSWVARRDGWTLVIFSLPH